MSHHGWLGINIISRVRGEGSSSNGAKTDMTDMIDRTDNTDKTERTKKTDKSNTSQFSTRHHHSPGPDDIT